MTLLCKIPCSIFLIIFFSDETGGGESEFQLADQKFPPQDSPQELGFKILKGEIPQRMKNAAARVGVSNYRLDISSHSIQNSLHWLPVRLRIDYKVVLTTYKTLTTGEPSYLSRLLCFHAPVRTLRSSLMEPA